ncbi:MAG: Fe-S cluster assembly protein IscX [candidate division Zixibacteria bacterium]|nr:Fe-S cluster assembly protein IscX [candidate division Zixibacteria bacterium]
MDWIDSDDIGFELFKKHPDMNPLDVRFTDLHKMILELDDFEGEPDQTSEGKLEAIQMSWLEEYNDK